MHLLGFPQSLSPIWGMYRVRTVSPIEKKWMTSEYLNYALIAGSTWPPISDIHYRCPFFTHKKGPSRTNFFLNMIVFKLVQSFGKEMKITIRRNFKLAHSIIRLTVNNMIRTVSAHNVDSNYLFFILLFCKCTVCLRFPAVWKLRFPSCNNRYSAKDSIIAIKGIAYLFCSEPAMLNLSCLSTMYHVDGIFFFSRLKMPFRKLYHACGSKIMNGASRAKGMLWITSVTFLYFSLNGLII